MNFIQEVLNLLERKQDKKKLDLNRDWFEFGRTKPSSVGNPLYAPKMTPHAIRYNDLKCNIISGLVQGTGTEHTLPMWSTVDPANCGVQTMVDSIFSQDAGATEGKVSGDFRVTGNTVLEGDLLVLGTQTIVESTVVEVADNIMRINSGAAAVDAGIEVIQPSGTKTWAWDNGDGVWSTFGESITTQDIKVNGAIKQDGETLINVVNEAEGLASQDNDNSLATVAAIIDYFQTNDSYVDNVQVVGTDMIFTGVNNGFSGTLDLSSLGKSYIVKPGVSPGGGVFGTIETIENGTPVHSFKVTPGNEWIKIDSDGSELRIAHKDSVTVPVTSASQNVDNGDTITSYKYAFDAAGHVTGVEQIASVLDITFPATSIDYVDSVSLVGTNLIFTGVGNAFSGTIDLSALLDDTNLSRIVSGAMSGTDLILTRNDASTISIDLSSLNNTGGIALSDIVAGDKINVSINGANQTVTVSHQTTTTTPTTSSTILSHSGTFEAIVDVTHDAYGHITGYETKTFTMPDAGTSADGNDFINNVQLTGTDLVFTGTGGAFSGSVDLSSFLDDVDGQTLSLSGTDLTISNGNTVDLSSLAGTSYTAGAGLTLAGSEFSMTDVARTNSSSAESPNHTDSFTVIDDITTNTKGQVTNVNVKTITLPASGTGADGVITNVVLNGTDLRFFGSNGGFNGTIDLSGLADGNATYTLGLVASGANDTVVKLTGANGGADSQFTLAGGAGISVTENTSTNTIVIASTVTDTNDIDYVSGVTLNGTNLIFDSVGNAFAGTVDLSSLQTTDTNDIDYVREVALNGDSLEFTGIGNAFTGSIDLSAYANVAETVTRLALNANILTYRDEAGVDTNIDLSLYLDDTNLARLVSGTLDNTTGIATFTRDDASTFTVDFSAFLADANTTYSFSVPDDPTLGAVTLLGSDGSTDAFRIVPGNDIAISTSNNTIRIDSTASGATYTAGTGLTLNGSTFDANVDAVVQTEVSNPVTAVKGRVYDVQVNAADELVVNVPWIDTQYSAGTYLSLSGSQFNHDNTTRTNTTSTASPAAGGTFTAIDSVTTNATGHVTGINTKTITLPEGGGGTSSACVTGLWYAPDQTGNQFLTSTFSVIGNPTLGFQNTDGVTKHYAISWTIQYAMSGSTGIKFFETQMVQEVGGSPTVLTESKWADSGYMLSEYSTTRTYTLYTNMAPGDIIYPQVKGSTDVFIKKAHIQVVETECESTRNGSITVIQGRT